MGEADIGQGRDNKMWLRARRPVGQMAADPFGNWTAERAHEGVAHGATDEGCGAQVRPVAAGFLEDDPIAAEDALSCLRRRVLA